MPNNAEELNFGYTREGRYIDRMEEAEQVVVFAPDGNHLVTFVPAPEGGWKVSEAPGFAPDTLDPRRRFDTEEEMRACLLDALA